MANTTGDPLVFSAQQWLNSTYGNDSRYNTIIENGKTGWNTIYALTRALQIELGITATADSFGPTTISKFNTQYPTGIHQQSSDDESENNIYAILQGALFCKGYATGVGTVTKHFYDGTGNAIKKLKSDAGCSDQSSTVTLNVMKALLSMDYFYSYDSSEETKNIQTIQRYLNKNYEAYIGLKPCDGVYGRGTNTALLYAIQAEEGLPVSVANGNFGPTTRNCCPTIPYNNIEKNYYGNTYSSSSISRFITLLKMGLYANGVGNGNFSGEIDTSLIKEFQHKYGLSVTGTCNLGTWMSTFVSSGDTNRAALACDCATILTTAKAQTLYNSGYRYVGRYLSGTIVGGASKALSKEELQIAFNAGLRIFPIQQGSATYVSYFTQSQAVEDVNSAYNYATNLGIPTNTIIYFAVDCDPQDTDITNYIIPYFKKIFETMRDLKNNKYRIGIYGTRNVCQRVSNLGYATTSFVSDMSTGFSGNLGFSIPNNWAFDQFATVTVGSGSGQIEIDKDGYSGRDSGINAIDTPEPDPEPNYKNPIGYDTDVPTGAIMVNTSSKSYNVYSTKVEGWTAQPGKSEVIIAAEDLGYSRDDVFGVQWAVSGNKVGEIQPGDFFVRFECRDHAHDNDPSFADRIINHGDASHKVLFRTTDGTVRYGYIQEYLTADDYNNNDSRRYGRENFLFYRFDPEQNKLVKDTLPIEYTIKKPLNYRAADGTILGTLLVGTKIRGIGNAGSIYNDYAYFKELKNADGTWEFINKAANAGAWVELGMQYGVNGYDRAIW